MEVFEFGEVLRVSDEDYSIIFDDNPVIEGPWGAVTYRSFPEYVDAGVPGDMLVREGKLVEGGAGLGELVPARAVIWQGSRPVAIDPVDYRRLSEMLELTVEHVARRGGRTLLLEELRERADIYSDKSLVRHLEMTLNEAVCRHPDAFEEASFYIDLCGPMTKYRQRVVGNFNRYPKL
jgi:hypothetical protein